MKFIDLHKDRWHSLGGEDGPPVSISPEPYLLLEVTQWHAVRSHWPQNMPLGISLGNDHDVEDIVPELDRFSLVVLRFPKWADGRAYSQARLLRSRFRFRGEVRATGEVLVDMLPLLKRTGFDSAVLRSDQSVAAGERALDFFRGYYQGDADDNRPLFAMPAGSAEKLASQSALDFVGQGASI
jgi:uncharacterized protein (DUF934 family)